eukprot:m.52988 g.52988  ORF g.52988 m.52988 type:complete len:573 (+) comp21685_c0_seq1:52-1770(+)
MSSSDELNAPLIYDDAEVVAPRETRRGSPIVAYIGLMVAVAAVAIGAVALYETKQNGQTANNNLAQASASQHLEVVTTAEKSASSNIVIAHPACQGSVTNYKTCMHMVHTMGNVISYAYQPNTTFDDLKNKITQDGFGLHNDTAVILHDGAKILASDSTMLGHTGARSNFLTNVSHCDFSFGTVCFACIPIPHTNMCLPIAHHVNNASEDLSSLDHSTKHRRESYSKSGSLFSKSDTASAVVGTPQVGGSIHGSASLTAGGYGVDASTTDTGNSVGAQESASATLVKGSASEEGEGQISKDGFGVTGSESADGNIYAGATEQAHADAGISDGTASFNLGASAEAKADASVDGTAQVGVETPFGDDASVIKAQGSAGVDAHAGASAGAQGSLSDQGVDFGYHADAGAGASATAQGSITGLDGAINIHGNVGTSVGPQVGTSGGFHATDKDGDISIGASGGLAAGLGIKAGASININTHAIGDDIVDGAEDVGNDIVNGVKSIGDDIGDAVDSDDTDSSSSDTSSDAATNDDDEAAQDSTSDADSTSDDAAAEDSTSDAGDDAGASDDGASDDY